MNYYKVATKSTIDKDVLEYALNDKPWYPYFNFSAKPLPPELLVEDKFFNWLHRRYDFVGGVLRLDPYTCYNWHKDTRRGVGINMILTPHARSVCAFADDISEAVFKIDELIYQPKTYYLFNTQANHTVYNFEDTRYILSIEFIKGADELSFNQLVDDVRSEYENSSI